ncbi:GNAT family N-acetyltransferase [Microbacterium fluvii]|uniref:GNAT family N-acetyltransferase n=1 Tax=Microbacterium fluvii TaxID=415215 RepID=A0ABW2HIL6_9MICO|nr:GNAT family N-acetyltransferase [Microbacterium fluvii]MCU4673908.1 N-acetyltransferase [Microbacterium fluvii]
MSDSIPSEITAEPVVTRDDRQERYEIHLGDVLAGFTEFVVDERGRLVFPHTEVDPAFRGRGYATTLIAGAMADVAARGETVVPRCPSVVRYLKQHDVTGLTVDWPTLDGERVG